MRRTRVDIIVSNGKDGLWPYSSHGPPCWTGETHRQGSHAKLEC